MSFDDIHRRLIKKFDPRVASEFKKMLHAGLESYRRHNTKAKLTSILMNLPLGAVFDTRIVERFLRDGRPPSYKELLDSLENWNEFNVQDEE